MLFVAYLKPRFVIREIRIEMTKLEQEICGRKKISFRISKKQVVRSLWILILNGQLIKHCSQ